MKIILGIGNLLNRDEGVGIHAIRQMQATHDETLPGYELVDGGTLGLNLLPLVEAASHLLVIDAVDGGFQAGTFLELTSEQIPLFSTIKLSPHQLSFQEVLGLAKVRGHFPNHLVLLGIQPADMSPGIELSESVSSALPELIVRAGEIMLGWR